MKKIFKIFIAVAILLSFVVWGDIITSWITK